MYRMMKSRNYERAHDAIEAVKNECEGTISTWFDENFCRKLQAFIWDSTKLEFEAAKDCSLRISGNMFGHSVYALGLKKNSPWTKPFSYAILELIESTFVLSTLFSFLFSCRRRHGTPRATVDFQCDAAELPRRRLGACTIVVDEHARLLSRSLTTSDDFLCRRLHSHWRRHCPRPYSKHRRTPLATKCAQKAEGSKSCEGTSGRSFR